MHFWIDKPAGRYRGVTDRRYPATPLLTMRTRRCGNSDRRLQMLAPVHEYQNINPNGNTAGPSNMNTCRVMRTTIRASNENQNNMPVGSTQHTQLNNTSNNVTNAGNNQLILSNNTSNGTNRSLLDFREFSDAELAGYRIRCGIYITFVLATGFVAAAKFYFGHQGLGLEILIFCGLLTVLLSGCLYSILCCRSQNNHLQEHHMPEEHITPLETTNIALNETIIRPIPVVRHNPPPPYHIAILIPPPNLSDEAPPPSYDKVMR